MSERNIRPGSIQAWLAFTRPKTWGVAVAPVLAALSLAINETQQFSVATALFTMTIAVLVQIITNMENDLGYTERKAERSNRRGLPRATSENWISISTAKTAIRVTIVLAIINTAVLITFGGWGFALIGLTSIVAAYAYMGGPKPIAYTPFGELTVLVFFGLTAVGGTYYLQTGFLSLNTVLLGISLGAVAATVLCINNWRDREHDSSINRQTLAVVMGEKNFRRLCSALVFTPFVLTALMLLRTPQLAPCLLVFLTIPLATNIVKQIGILRHEALNSTMFTCVKFELFFALLFSIGALISLICM